jgi:Uma2 family endonuclease
MCADREGPIMVATKQATLADLQELDGDLRVELIEGEIVDMSPAGSRHGGVIRALQRRLDAYLDQQTEIEMYGGDIGYVVGRDPDSVLGPDLVLVTNAQKRLLVEAEDAFAPLAPLIAIEVKSPSDREAMIARKTAIYLAAGVQEIWWVRPKERQIGVHRPDAAPRILHEGDILESPDLLPGFSLPLTSLFDLSLAPVNEAPTGPGEPFPTSNPRLSVDASPAKRSGVRNGRADDESGRDIRLYVLLLEGSVRSLAGTGRRSPTERCGHRAGHTAVCPYSPCGGVSAIVPSPATRPGPRWVAVARSAEARVFAAVRALTPPGRWSPAAG